MWKHIVADFCNDDVDDDDGSNSFIVVHFCCLFGLAFTVCVSCLCFAAVMYLQILLHCSEMQHSAVISNNYYLHSFIVVVVAVVVVAVVVYGIVHS